VSSTRFAVIALGTLLGVVAAPSQARADASAWVFMGAGPMFWKQTPAAPTAQDASPTTLTPLTALTFDAGMGTSPNGVVIVGGLARVMPMLGRGTDLALLVRAATRGYQGGFGLALDAGGYFRTWGDTSNGFMGDLVLGGPVGLELRLVAAVGQRDALSLGAIAGIDLLRLTVYRQNGLKWWQNPAPAQEMPRTARAMGSGARF
jgi:hypothetical protein